MDISDFDQLEETLADSAGPPVLVRILVKFSLGEMGGLLVKSKKSW